MKHGETIGVKRFVPQPPISDLDVRKTRSQPVLENTKVRFKSHSKNIKFIDNKMYMMQSKLYRSLENIFKIL